MGDIAEGLINGDFDQYTGEYIGRGGGFPRSKMGGSKKIKTSTPPPNIGDDGVAVWSYLNYKKIYFDTIKSSTIKEWATKEGLEETKCSKICIHINRDSDSWERFILFVNQKFNLK